MAKKSDVSALTSDNKWQAEDDHRTLLRADEVTSDRKRLSAAKQHGKRQLKAITRVMSAGRR